MKSFWQLYGLLRRRNIRSYVLLAVCNFISVLLITSFAVVMQSGTVQTMLPEGGDSRKQMTMIFIMAIVGCAVFTTYASGIFFRSKSKELGIYMALGARKKKLSKLIYSDLALVALVSSISGMLLGTPLAIGIWQIFRMLVVDSADMVFSMNLTAYLWPLAFTLFTTAALFLSGWRFLRRSNIIDVVHQQRKSEPIRDVKSWYGVGGILLMLLGVTGAVMIPNSFAAMGYTPPFWTNILYLFAAAGLYMVLIYIVVRGFGGRKSHYKNIIPRSMMKFQGRQTVLNMCVITVLIMAAYFAMFYISMQIGSASMGFDSRPVDYAFHYRIDEAGIPDREAIQRIAAEEQVTIRDYAEVEFVNLAADGFDREWTDDGRFGNEYHEFYTEESFLSESAFRALGGGEVNVHPGQYIFITSADYSHSPYDYIEDMTLFSNPDTRESLDVKFQEEIHHGLLHRYILLNDADYAYLTTGLSDEWREKWTQFNADNADDTYAFAKRLKNAIIDGSTEKSAMYENYDRVEKLNANGEGIDYRGDVEPELQVDYAMRESSQFNQYWRYIPYFRVLDRQDFIMNLSVFLMLFVFMAIICLTAVIVIAYTRCLTIADNNRQVYDDLRHLGAKRDYLYRSVKGQVSKVFLVPASIGTLGISGFFVLLMYGNSGGFDAGELQAFAISAALLAAISLLLWTFYRLTLRKVGSMLGVNQAIDI